MNTKKLLLKSLLFSLFAIAFVSCSDDDDPVVPQENWQKEGAYILNSGKSGNNNATLGYYVKAENNYSELFETANSGLKLGDTANDMLVYGGKVYIAMSGSTVIRVLDRSGKQQTEISSKSGSVNEEPRSLTAYNGKVYVSYFDGYVSRIDTSSLAIDKTVAVGRNPEQLKVSNNKLFVANSGGMGWATGNYDKTVSVIDLNSFNVVKSIEVLMNPVSIQVDKSGYVYVISMGNYNDILNTLQRIDPTTYEVKTVTNATEMGINGDKTKIYYVYSQWDNAGNNIISYLTYNTQTGKVSDTSFITDNTTISNFYKLSIDPSNDDIYVSTSDYTNNGDMYVFSSAGKLKNKFTIGLNGMGAFFPQN